MKIAVIGANCRTGRIVANDALARGNQVVAVTRTDRVSKPDTDSLINARADVRKTLRAIEPNGAAKQAVISAGPAGPWEEQPLLQRRIALPLLQRFFGASYDDMRRMESILQETTDVGWISLRGHRAWSINHLKAPTGLTPARAITYGDLPTALLDSLTRQDLYGHAAYVAN